MTAKDLMKLVATCYTELLQPLKTKKYYASNKFEPEVELTTPADTRVRHISLLSHLQLTAGIAVAITRELLGRGKSALELTGSLKLQIQNDELVQLIRLAALMHDIGKDHEKHYIGHRQRGVQRAKEWLGNQNISTEFTNLVLRAIDHHQLNYGPQEPFENIVCLSDALASAGDRAELALASSREQLIKISSRTSDLFNRVFEGESGIILMLGNLNSIQNYVFESKHLPEIRGASEKLARFNWEILPQYITKVLSPECIIFSGGGNFLVLVPVSLQVVIKAKIQQLLFQTTQQMTVTIVTSPPIKFFQWGLGLAPNASNDIQPYFNQLLGSQTTIQLENWSSKLATESTNVGVLALTSHYFPYVLRPERHNWTKVKNFAENVSYLSAKLRWEKGNQLTSSFIEKYPWSMTCSSCGKRPVVVQGFDGRREKDVCHECWIKRKVGQGGKGRSLFLETHHLQADFFQRPGFDAASQTWEPELFSNSSSVSPADLESLAFISGEIAVIYADGNKIGRILSQATGPADYRSIAEQLELATRASTFWALTKTLKAHKIANPKILPFEILTLGGDDVVIIIDAALGFTFAYLFLEAFSKFTFPLASQLGRHQQETSLIKASDRENTKVDEITASLGMVICHYAYPIRFAMQLATQLLKDFAKRKSGTNKGNQSAIDYIILTGSDVYTTPRLPKSMYRGRWTNKIGKYPQLSIRPLSLSEYQVVLQQTNQLLQMIERKIIGRSQLYQLQREFTAGFRRGRNFLTYLIARLSSSKQQVLEDFFQNNTSPDGFPMDFGWIQDGAETPRSPLIDWIELTNFFLTIKTKTNYPFTTDFFTNYQASPKDFNQFQEDN